LALVTAENRRWWTLGSVTFSLFVIMLDNTVVNVALPTIQRDLGTTISELEWIVNAYALTFAALLLTGGKLADYLGRRKIFLVGIAVFTLSSLWCALAWSGGALIAARAVQGVGAAFMIPATISIITSSFRVEERGAAFGIWGGISGAGLAIGPMIGGLLVQHASWPWIFYINVPIGVIGTVLAIALVPESRDLSETQRLDIAGLFTSGAFMFLLTYAFVEANNYGWGSTRIVLSFVGAGIGLAAFLALELRQRAPMLNLAFFRNPTFAGANAVGLLLFCSLLGFIFFVSLYLQDILGYSPVQTGATFLVSTVAIMFAAPIGGKLSDTIGARVPMVLGMTGFGASLLVLSQVMHADTGFWTFAPWLLVGGVLQGARQLGGALGIAVAGALMAAETGNLMTRTPAFRDAFVTGLEHLMIFLGIVSIVGAVVALFTIRIHEHLREPTESYEPTGAGV
jgi:EmrB/QacA subfamily drug resistance transporter